MPSALEMVMMLGKQMAAPKQFQPTDITSGARDFIRIGEQQRHARALEAQQKAVLEENRRASLEAEEQARQTLAEKVQERYRKSHEYATDRYAEQAPLTQHKVKGPAARAVLQQAGFDSMVGPQFPSSITPGMSMEDTRAALVPRPAPETAIPEPAAAPVQTPVAQPSLLGMQFDPSTLSTAARFAASPVTEGIKALGDKLFDVGGIQTNAPEPTPEEEQMPVTGELSAIDSKQQGKLYRHYFSQYGGYIDSIPLEYLDKKGREALNMAVKGLDELDGEMYTEGMIEIGAVEDVVEGVTKITEIKNANKRASSMSTYRTRGEQYRIQKDYIDNFTEGKNDFEKLVTKDKINGRSALEESERKFMQVKEFIRKGGDNPALVGAARYIIASMREPGARLTDKDIESTEGAWSYAQENKKWLKGKANPDSQTLREMLERMSGEIDIVQTIHRRRMKAFVERIYKIGGETQATIDHWKGFNKQADASFKPKFWPWVEQIKKDRDRIGPQVAYERSGDGGQRRGRGEGRSVSIRGVKADEAIDALLTGE